MRVLSVQQPWAQLLITGNKAFEIRTWKTDFRGRIALHVSSALAPGAYQLAVDEPAYADAYARSGIGSLSDLRQLQKSAIVGTIEIADVQTRHDLADSLTGDEREMFETVDDDTFMWRMLKPIAFDPVAIKGKLNLWTLPDDVAAEVSRRERSAIAPIRADVISRARRAWQAAAAEEDRKLEQILGAPVIVSGPLRDFVGKTDSTRGAVLERLNAHLESNALASDAKDAIRVDAVLRKLLGGKKVRVTRGELVGALAKYTEDAGR